MDLTEEIKKQIDDMPYNEMLSKWFFASTLDPMFQGTNQDYFIESMRSKHEALHMEVAV